jgi:hypothetical protein
MAREGARWASVHGWQYNQDTGNATATPQSIYTNAIQPHAAPLDTSGMSFNSSGGQGTSLDFTVTWLNSNQKTKNWDSTNQVWMMNTVTVTVTYTWAPQLYLGPVTLSSTSVVTIQY